ncbi:MAG: RNA polymerase sigma factor [Ilumatobacteraceae bacterium]
MHHRVAPAPIDVDSLDASWAATIDRLRAFVTGRVGDPELAADITHDVVARAIASGALERVDHPVVWLYRAARDAVLDLYRTRRAHDTVDHQPVARARHARRRTERRKPRLSPRSQVGTNGPW